MINVDDSQLNWPEIELALVRVLERDGYEGQKVGEIAFAIRQNLENSLPLLKSVAKRVQHEELKEIDSEETIVQIHMLLQNHDNLQHAYGLLMYEEEKPI